MKLGTIVAFSMALALPATINAQEMSFSQSWDASGVNFRIDDAYEGGQVAIFMSLDTGRTDLGILSLDLHAPVLLAYDTSTMLGTYDLRIWVDTQALADMGLTVYLQAVSLGSEQDAQSNQGDPQPGQGLPIQISEQVEIDFGAQKQAGSKDANEEPVNPEDEVKTTDAVDRR